MAERLGAGKWKRDVLGAYLASVLKLTCFTVMLIQTPDWDRCCDGHETLAFFCPQCFCHSCTKALKFKNELTRICSRIIVIRVKKWPVAQNDVVIL